VYPPDAAMPKDCVDKFGGGGPAVCCPSAPDCKGMPDGWPGYVCVARENQFCTCHCAQGTWRCGC
jgi:hypothetical protein